MIRVDDLTLAAAPIAATAVTYLNRAPWWLCLILGLSGPVAHAYRTFILFRLATCALSKADTPSLPAIMATITGLSGPVTAGKQK